MVTYIQVAFMDGQDIQKQYIYENVDVWVWNTFLGEKCTYNGYVACTCCGGNLDEENTGEWLDFNICIRDIKSNGEYFINISKHGLINVYDGKAYSLSY